MLPAWIITEIEKLKEPEVERVYLEILELPKEPEKPTILHF